jgi:hypothetical protein
VHYVFPRFHLDNADAFEALNAKTDWRGKEGLVVVWDVAYDWQSGGCCADVKTHK